MTHNKMIRISTAMLLAAVLTCCMTGFGPCAIAPPVSAQAATPDGSAPGQMQGVWISFHDYEGAGLRDKSEKNLPQMWMPILKS